ncbi:MAG: T9SS type A sorting domain-containing protein [Flavobacteriales bacterium]|nr:T9SS type A sorting domain-containing protein [Flavobacteriales bacterium]MEB2342544.1 T9SS type A sorting domain-containing protein [Flavobacteriia bacterium]
MNRLYAVAAAFSLLTVGAQAQQNGSTVQRNMAKPQKDNTVKVPANRVTPMGSAQRDVVFSEDFANGFAGNNGVGAWTTDGPNGNVWRYTHTGPVGAYSNTGQAIASPTASNGWMIFNSDSANTNWSANPPVIVASPVDLVGGLISPVLDFSANPNLELRVSQRFRWCCAGGADPYHLDISTDGGSTWPVDKSFSMTSGIGANTDSQTREFAVVIAGAIADDASNVRLRFRHDASGVSHYHWQVDDIVIATVPEFELILDYGFLAQYGSQPGLGGACEYHRLQPDQIESPMQVGGGITNYGYADQNNVQLHISMVDESSQEVGALTIDVGTLASGETIDLEDAMDINNMPLPYGKYTCNFWITSDNIGDDANPTDNTAVRYMVSSENLTSLDGIGVIPSDDLFLAAGGTNSWTDNTTDVRLLTYIDVREATTFTGVEVYLANASDPGSYFIGAIYDTTDVWGEMNSPLAETDIRILDDVDVSVRTTAASFLEPVMLQPGGYFVTANMYQESGANMRILDDLTVPQPNAASLIWLANDDNHLYTNGNAWAVRLSTLANVSVQMHPALEGVTLYPNPNDGVFTVQVTSKGNMTVEVFDMVGNLVHSNQFNGISTQLDLSSQAAGVYTVRVGDGTNYNMQRVAIK